MAQQMTKRAPSASFPTGVIDGRRQKLGDIFYALRDVPIELFRELRIACRECGGCQYVNYDNSLYWCETCDNRGYVCPNCLGDRWLADRTHRLKVVAIRCPSCTIGLSDKMPFDEMSERASVQVWLDRYFPDGVTATALDYYTSDGREAEPELPVEELAAVASIAERHEEEARWEWQAGLESEKRADEGAGFDEPF